MSKWMPSTMHRAYTKKISPPASCTPASLMWKNVASQGADRSQATPTQMAAAAVVTITTRSEWGSSALAIRPNASSTFCGPSSARKVTRMSAKLRLLMATIMTERPEAISVAWLVHRVQGVGQASGGVYDRLRVTVVLALYDGSGWGRA